MAAVDACMFPVKGQAYRFAIEIRSSSTGNQITGGLTGLDIEVSKDGAQFANAAGTVTEITASGGGGSGFCVVDLTSADMDGYLIIAKLSASNSNQVVGSAFITPAVLSETETHWLLQGVKRIEQGFMQLFAYFLNKVRRPNAPNSMLTMYKIDGTTPYLEAATSNDGTTEEKGAMG